MNFKEFLVTQADRNDFVGSYANKVMVQNSITEFDSLDKHLDYEMNRYPEDSYHTISVLLSRLEFCQAKYLAMATSKSMTADKIRNLRNRVQKCMAYLQIYWEELLFGVFDKATSQKIQKAHSGLFTWSASLEEQETELRFFERQAG